MSEISIPSVLVVDDDRVIADTLVAVLSMSGYEAVAAYSGKQALTIAHARCFDYLLTDVIMDGMNGIDLAIAIRAISPQCHIQLMSAHNDAGALLAEAMSKGHTFSILAKPFHPTFLLENLRAYSMLPKPTIN
jgi:CheY-like chemotaxis protein